MKSRLGRLSSPWDGSRHCSLVAPLASPHALPSRFVVFELAVAAGRCYLCCCCCQRSRFLCCAYAFPAAAAVQPQATAAAATAATTSAAAACPLPVNLAKNTKLPSMLRKSSGRLASHFYMVAGNSKIDLWSELFRMFMALALAAENSNSICEAS